MQRRGTGPLSGLPPRLLPGPFPEAAALTLRRKTNAHSTNTGLLCLWRTGLSRSVVAFKNVPLCRSISLQRMWTPCLRRTPHPTQNRRCDHHARGSARPSLSIYQPLLRPLLAILPHRWPEGAGNRYYRVWNRRVSDILLPASLIFHVSISSCGSRKNGNPGRLRQKVYSLNPQRSSGNAAG
jgi:hypothetical protein